MCDTAAADEVRKSVILHSKVMVCESNSEGMRAKQIEWIYIGSHNFTGSAWGRLQKSNQQLHVANYELGVVFLPQSSKKIYQHIEQNIPFAIPPPRYKSTDKAFIFDLL